MPDLRKMRALAGQLRDKRAESAHVAGHKKWYDIRNTVGDTTEVYLYDMIGEDMWGDGISARDFSAELKQVNSPVIDLHINCEGGEVFDGIAIYECLKQHNAEVHVSIDSLAASAASFIAMAAAPGHLKMARNSRMMIHDAAMGGAYASGNAADMRDFAKAVEEMADLLDDMSLNIADIYAQRAGGTAADWRTRMQAETWYSAQAAIDAGLADGVVGEEEVTPTDAPAAEEAAENALDLGALVAAIEGVFRA